jgi:hypothetical protein
MLGFQDAMQQLGAPPNSLLGHIISLNLATLFSSVADPNPDPPDPRVFGPPGSGSGSTSQRYDPDPLWIRILLSSCKNSKKNLDSYYFVTLFEFFSLQNDRYKCSFKKS